MTQQKSEGLRAVDTRFCGHVDRVNVCLDESRKMDLSANRRPKKKAGNTQYDHLLDIFVRTNTYILTTEKRVLFVRQQKTAENG